MYKYHVFGHHAGRYQVITHSPDLPQNVLRALDQFGFGQTNDAAYLDSLERNPALIWRTAAQHAFITRVRAGAPDGAGRATLRFETLIIPRNEAAQVAGRLAAVVRGEWEFGDEQVIVVPAAAAAPGALHGELVNRALLTIEQHKRYHQDASAASYRDIEKIVQQAWQQRDFSLAYRSLSETMPVAVNFIAKDVPTRALPGGGGAADEGRVAANVVGAPAQGGAPSTGALLWLLLMLTLAQTVLIGVLLIDRPVGDQLAGDAQSEILTRIVDRSDYLEKLVRDAHDESRTHATRVTHKQGVAISAAQEKLSESFDEAKTAFGGVAKEVQRQLNDLDKTIRNLAPEIIKGFTDAQTERVEPRLDQQIDLLDQMSDRLVRLEESLGALREFVPQLTEIAERSEEGTRLLQGVERLPRDALEERIAKLRSRFELIRRRVDEIQQLLAGGAGPENEKAP